MDFIDLIKKRVSIRGYENTPVEDTVLDNLFEKMRFAPSACNLQSWVIIVVRDRAVKNALGNSYTKQWFTAAPVIIAVGFDKRKSWKRFDGKEYGCIDAAIALDHLTLAATELGLGTCWIGAFKEDVACKVLTIPDYVELVAMTPLGYPKEFTYKKIRNEIDTFVFWDRYGNRENNSSPVQ